VDEWSNHTKVAARSALDSPQAIPLHLTRFNPLEGE
jgi:hypothetical protein